MPDVVPKIVAQIFTRVLLVENSGTHAHGRDDYAETLLQEIRSRIHPTPSVHSRWLQTEVGIVLEFTIGMGEDRPYQVLRTAVCYFLRVGATNRRMSREELEIRFGRQSPALIRPH